MIKKLTAAFLIWLIGGWPTIVFALPSGGKIVSGTGSIVETSTTQLDVNQQSSQLIATFQNFNTAVNETVNVNQQHTSDTFLAKVLGTDPTLFLGKLNAKGQVFITNGSGVFFGPGSQIDVHGLVATTMDISNQDFLDRNYRFAQDLDNPLASVINEGVISATSYVGLLAPAVENRNKIVTASLGSIDLASGTAATMDFTGDGLIQFEVTQAVSGTVLDKDGNELEDRVSNKGLLQANGGQIRMSAKDAGDVIRHVVNMEGTIRANSVVEKDGKVFLMGGDSGIVNVSGTIDASGDDAGEKGGTVQVTGEYVGLFDNAKVDVSGDAGGGEALIGGDYQGKNDEVQNAKRTYIGKDAVIDASAGTEGDGGKVIVWADDVTRFYGSVFAIGGSNSGNGGFVETSGKNFLDARGFVNTLAPNGELGTWLLDPTNVIIASSGSATLGDVSTFGSGSGTETLDVSLINGSSSNIVIQANNDITVNAAINITNSGTTLTLHAGDDILINANITTNDGAITISANHAGASETGIGSQGVVTMADGTTINAGNQNILIFAQGDVTLENLTTTGNVDVNSTDASIVEASSDHLITGATVTLNAATTAGEGVGTNANRINTTATTLAGTAGTGGFFVDETDAVILSSISITGAGDLTISTTGAVTVTSASTTNGNVSITASDIGITSLNAGAGDVTIIASGGGDIGLGDTTTSCAGSTCEMIISGAELQLITAGNLILGDTTTTSITVDNVSATNSNGISGTVTLNATAATGVVTFDTAASTFNAVTVNAGNGISLTANLTTDMGNLILEGDSDNATGGAIAITGGATLTSAGSITLDATNGGIVGAGAVTVNADNGLFINDNFSAAGNLNLDGDSNNSVDGNDKLTFASGITITSSSTGTLTLDATNGGIEAAGALTLNADDDVLVNDNFTSLAAGAIIIDGNVDNSGNGGLFVAGSKTFDTNNNNLSVTGGDITIAGSIDAGTGDVTLLVSGGGVINVGATTGGMQIDNTELNNITAANVNIGDGTAGAITVHGLTGNANITNLNITSGSSVSFVSGASTVTNNLAVVAGGNITGTAVALTVGGTSSFTVTGSSLILLSNASNAFSGAITFSSGTGSVQLKDTTDTILAASTLGNDLTVESVGNITQTGALSVTRFSEFKVTGGASTITLTDASNYFEDSITLTSSGSSGAVQLTNTTNTSFFTSMVDGDLTIITSGNITQLGQLIVMGNSSFTVSGSSAITLTAVSNNFTGGITLSGVTGAIAVTDSSATTVTSVTTTGGSFTLLTTTGGITLADNAISTGAGNVSLSSSLGSITEASSNMTANITTSGTVSLTAGTSIGTSGANNEVDIATATDLTFNVNDDLFVNGSSGQTISALDVTVDPTGAATYTLAGFNADQTFNMTTDGTNLTITDVSNTGAVNQFITAKMGNVTVTNFDSDGGNIGLLASTGNIILNDNAINAGAGNVTVTSVAGNISETNNNATAKITTTGSVSLSGATGIGSVTAIDVSGSSSLSINSGQNIGVVSDTNLSDLNVTLDPSGSCSGACLYSITATGLTFTVTDSTSDTMVTEVTETALNFSLTASTGNIILANTAISTGTGSVSLTSTAGSINELISNTMANITTSGAISLTGMMGVGDTSTLDVAGSSNLSIDTENSFDVDVDGATLTNLSIIVNPSNSISTYTLSGASNITAFNLGIATGDLSIGVITATALNLSLATSANDIVIAGAITIGNGNLAVSSAGDITQSTEIIHSGSSSFTVSGSKLITLTNASNDFGGAVSVIAGTGLAQITDMNAIVLGSSTTTGNLVVVAGGAVTQTGSVTASGLAISTTGAVTLNNVLNNVNTLSISATGNVNYTDSNAFTVGTVNSVDGVSSSGSVQLTAVTGNITVSNTGAANDIDAATGITILLSADEALFTVNSGAEVENTSTGDIVITADIMDLTGTVRATSQRVTLKSSTNDDEIALGFLSGAQANRLELSSAELNNIYASYLEIGSTTQGDITVLSDITPLNIMRLHLISGKKVTASAGGIVFSHLAIEAGGDVSFTDTTTDVDLLAIDAQGFDVSFYDADDLDINTVDGVVGVKAKSFTHNGPGPLTETSPIVLDGAETEEITPEVQEAVDQAEQAGLPTAFVKNALGDSGC